jgi:hypothetical protein
MMEIGMKEKDQVSREDFTLKGDKERDILVESLDFVKQCKLQHQYHILVV